MTQGLFAVLCVNSSSLSQRKIFPSFIESYTIVTSQLFVPLPLVLRLSVKRPEWFLQCTPRVSNTKAAGRMRPNRSFYATLLAVLF